MENILICPKCHTSVPPQSYFCLNCGSKLRDKPLSTSIGRQLVIYLLSALLPPLGLWWGIKYLKQPGQNAKIIGLVASILTTISLIITVWFTVTFVRRIEQQVNVDMQKYQFMGY